MIAKQFEHFLNLQQGLAGLNRSARRTGKPAPKPNRRTESAVAAAKNWLTKAARIR
jgi:hypothetical protein